YTSGSTGKPKGVMVEHRGLCNLVTAQAREFAVDHDSRILQFASFSFDACSFEFVFALCHGGALQLFESARLSGQELADLIQETGITHAVIPPAVLILLPFEKSFGTRRTIIAAGDALPAAVAASLARDYSIFNAYGPTEATIWATLHKCCSIAPGATNIPIGRPISNTRIYILDARGR
ncbi:AMP-binding protein, partial [Methylosinus sp. Sm6]|uniref:AMP-binding protein n=1 Tax=Methylosinus sp. Sm6 TaxID=2866948 RepID=UPI001C997415